MEGKATRVCVVLHMPVSGVEVQLRYFLRSAAILATWHRGLVEKYEEGECQNKRRLVHSNVLNEVATTLVCLSVCPRISD